MKCPQCNTETEEVLVYSQCRQRGMLKGLEIVDYGNVEDILDTVGIECPNCSHDLRGIILE